MDNKFTWNDITIEDFDLINDVVTSNLNDIDKEIELVKILSHNDAIESEPLSVFWREKNKINLLSTEITPNRIRKTYIINNKEYKCTQSLDKLTTGQYIDFCNYSKNKTIKDTAKIVATLLNTDEYDEIYRHCSVADAYGIVSFFTKCLAKSQHRLLDFLTIQKVTEAKVPLKTKIQMLKDLRNMEKVVLRDMGY